MQNNTEHNFKVGDIVRRIPYEETPESAWLVTLKPELDNLVLYDCVIERISKFCIDIRSTKIPHLKFGIARENIYKVNEIEDIEDD